MKTVFIKTWIVLSLLLIASPRSAHADFTFGAPTNIDTTMPFFPNSVFMVNSLSSDGLELFIELNLAGGQGNFDLWVLRRASPNADWGPPENLGSQVNSAGMDEAAFISADGLELYFNSDRSGGNGTFDLYVSKRATRSSPWGPAANLGPPVNSPYMDATPCVSSDGLNSTSRLRARTPMAVSISTLASVRP